ncbi:unnamed protein product, partial [Porites evermanni]
FIPYDEDLEPNATVEAAAAFEESVILEEDRNLELQRHFTGEIGACTCLFCLLIALVRTGPSPSGPITTKTEECICCKEMDRVREVWVK